MSSNDTSATAPMPVADVLHTTVPRASVSNPSSLSGRKLSKDEKLALEKERIAWSKTLTLADVKFNDDMTDIVDIKGKAIKDFVGKMLISFCRANQVKIRDGEGSKKNCVAKIIAYKKGEPIREKIAKTIQKRKSKETRPLSVTMEGTLYRVVLTMTHPRCRQAYLRTMSKRSRDDIDTGTLSYQTEWSELKDFYMDDTIDELSTLGEGNKYFGYGAADNAPSLFDPLSEREFSEVTEHINFHYDKVMKNISKSGSHDQFSDFIHKKGWLLFYNCLLKELNDEHMHQAAFAVLPGGVFQTSSSTHQMDNDLVPCSLNSTSPFGKIQKNEARKLLSNAITDKNIAGALFTKAEMTISQEKRFDELEDRIFELQEQHSDLKRAETKLKKKFEEEKYSDEEEIKYEMTRAKKKRKDIRSKLAVAETRMIRLKSEMNLDGSDAESSSSSELDITC